MPALGVTHPMLLDNGPFPYCSVVHIDDNDDDVTNPIYLLVMLRFRFLNLELGN